MSSKSMHLRYKGIFMFAKKEIPETEQIHLKKVLMHNSEWFKEKCRILGYDYSEFFNLMIEEMRAQENPKRK